MNKLKPILDNGHAGMINGIYATPGKRSPQWPKGVLYEGAFNRWVVNLLMRKLDKAKIPYYHVSPELTDVSLNTRVDRANEIYSIDKDVYFMSMHANAGGGQGHEQFTSVGETMSDKYATRFLKGIESMFPQMKMRYDRTDGGQ